jgi:hypothetical protein
MIGRMKALAAGVLLGLLFAPRSGRESRRRLAHLVDRFFETGSRELDRLEEELAEAELGEDGLGEDDLVEDDLPEDELPDPEASFEEPWDAPPEEERGG